MMMVKLAKFKTFITQIEEVGNQELPDFLFNDNASYFWQVFIYCIVFDEAVLIGKRRCRQQNGCKSTFMYLTAYICSRS